MELSAEDEGVLDVGAGSEGGGKGVVVWSEKMGGVNMVKEVESTVELAATSEISKKTIKFDEVVSEVLWYAH